MGSPLHNTVIAVLGIMTLFFGATTFYYRNELKSRESLVPLPSTTTVTVASTSLPAPLKAAPPSTHQPLSQLAKLDNSEESSAPSHFDRWKANQIIGEIEEFTVLEPSEKDSLAARLARNVPLDTALRDVVGDMRAAKIESYRQEAFEKRRQERIDARLFQLSRKLVLTPEQEPLVRQILTQLDDEMSEITKQLHTTTDEITSEHEDPKADRGKLREKYEEMKRLTESIRKTEDESLQARLKDVLTETQYNKYLAEEATGASSAVTIY